MNETIAFISQPWPWYVAGPCIAFIMIALVYFGKRFGVSSNLRTMCAMIGGGKSCDLFDFNWKDQTWNLVFLIGAMIGGYLAQHYLTPDQSIQISSKTVQSLTDLGISKPGEGLVPGDLFQWNMLLSLKGLIMFVGGGFLIGFGTRYAGGCTSGHAISGLSNLQIPSLIAVVGFFIGGLIMTFGLLPFILKL